MRVAHAVLALGLAGALLPIASLASPLDAPSVRALLVEGHTVFHAIEKAPGAPSAVRPGNASERGPLELGAPERAHGGSVDRPDHRQ